MKALVGAFNQEKALVGAFSVIVQPVVEPMEHYTALIYTDCCYNKYCVQINLLTTVMSDVPVLPDEDDEDALPMLLDSPQCVAFGIFVIW